MTPILYVLLGFFVGCVTTLAIEAALVYVILIRDKRDQDTSP